MNNEKRPLLVHIATVPEFFHSFFQGQLEFLVKRGFDIGLICSPGGISEGLKAWPVHYYPVPIQRRISPCADIISLWRIVRILRSIRPNIVHVHTSKAGLLGMIGAWIIGVRVRIFTIHGFRWVTKRGISRWLIKVSNRITCLLADRVFCVSKSNLEIGIQDRICSVEKASVICKGSINGVDATGRFNPQNKPNRGAVRKTLGIPEDAFAFGFVGRIVRDKGICELADAWRSIRKDCLDAHLIMIGEKESGDPVPQASLAVLEYDERVHFTGFCREVAPYYEAMDAFVLPSYREGFPVTPLEASAMGLPVIATGIRGCLDAVVHGKTGVLIPPRRSYELEQAMRAFLNDRRMPERLSEGGRKFVMENFQPKPIWKELANEYRELLKSHPSKQTGLPLFVKRVMDLLVVMPTLSLLLPVIAGVAILIRCNLGSPVIYRDKRIGKGGKSFWFVKFRTMTNETDSKGNFLPDEKRLTSVGRFFRATSLDELPQLLNILKGEMSLVGPRPLPLRYLERFTDSQAIRHAVMPGVTGFTAITYKGNDRSWSEKFEHDIWYVKNWSLLLDWKIFFKTIWVVGKKSLLNRGGETTSEEFKKPEGVDRGSMGWGEG